MGAKLPPGVERRDHYTAFRFTDSEYRRIKTRAREHDMTMTEFVVQSCLGELDVGPADIERRFDQIEDRLTRLEQYRDLGGFG